MKNWIKKYSENLSLSGGGAWKKTESQMHLNFRVEPFEGETAVLQILTGDETLLLYNQVPEKRQVPQY